MLGRVEDLEFFLIWLLGVGQGACKSLGIILLKLSYMKQASARRGACLGTISEWWLSQNVGIRTVEFSQKQINFMQRATLNREARINNLGFQLFRNLQERILNIATYGYDPGRLW